MPLWLSTMIVIIVDRATSSVAELAKQRRETLD